MPQMAPLNWLMLFMFFIMIMLLFISQIYYSYLIKTPKLTSSASIMNKSSWKW